MVSSTVRRSGIAATAAGGTTASVAASSRGDPDYAAALAESRARIDEWPAQERARTRALVRYATLAGNSHNTQPWRFTRVADRIAFEPDPDRRCPAVDPQDRHLVASLGCAAENLVLAAGAAGLHAEVDFEPERRRTEAILTQGPVRRPEAYHAIPERQSTRTRYDPAPLATEEVARLVQAARPGVAALVYTSRADIEAIGEHVVEAAAAQCHHRAFVKELVHWIRFNEAHAVRTRDGLSASATGSPSVPPWLGRLIFPLVFTAKSERDKYLGQIGGTAGVVVLVPETDGPEGWFAVGRTAQRIQLEATAIGVRTSYLNQPVEVDAVRPGFARWLGVDGRPALVMRFGRGPVMPYSLRRPVDDVLFSR